MVTSNQCVICESKKGLEPCGLCGSHSCKAHVHDLGAEAFSFMTKIPKDLTARLYCPLCFDAKIAEPLARYEELLAKANDIYYLSRDYPGYVHVLRRHTRRVSVPDCDDRRETILRLAYVAAELGMNAIIESEVVARKDNKGKYKSHRWSGTAVPAIIDGEQLERTSLKRI